MNKNSQLLRADAESSDDIIDPKLIAFLMQGKQAKQWGQMSKKKLLCVDDEPAGLRVRKFFLEHQGYEVLTAEAGAEGLDAFQSNDVDVVVLDYFMPGMDGGTVASAMKQSKPDVPIILLSAYLSIPSSVSETVDAFVIKGEAPEVLLGKIAELSNRVSI